MAPGSEQCLGFWGPVWQPVVVLGMSENCIGILSDMLSSCQIRGPGNKYLGLFLVKDTPENSLLCGITWEGFSGSGTLPLMWGKPHCRIHWHHRDVLCMLPRFTNKSALPVQMRTLGLREAEALAASDFRWPWFCFLLSWISRCLPGPPLVWLSALQIHHVQTRIPSFPPALHLLISNCFPSWVSFLGNVSPTTPLLKQEPGVPLDTLLPFTSYASPVTRFSHVLLLNTS